MQDVLQTQVAVVRRQRQQLADLRKVRPHRQLCQRLFAFWHKDLILQLLQLLLVRRVLTRLQLAQELLLLLREILVQLLQVILRLCDANPVLD